MKPGGILFPQISWNLEESISNKYPQTFISHLGHRSAWNFQTCSSINKKFDRKFWKKFLGQGLNQGLPAYEADALTTPLLWICLKVEGHKIYLSH